MDGDLLASWLAAIPGIENVSSLTVAPSSRMRDLKVVAGLPNLVNIQVNGLNVESLDGLRHFRQGRFLAVDTGANRRRSIAAISETSLPKVSLQYGNEQDFDAIATNASIGHLVLGGSPRPPLESWGGVPISTLSLSSGTFAELSGMSAISSLKELVVNGCRKLEAFVADDNSVKWLVIQQCPRLDVVTVKAFRRVEYLTVVGKAKPFSFSGLGALVHAKSISLLKCQVEMDVMNLGAVMPQLEELEVTGLQAAEAVRLSTANPGVTISTGARSYRAGAARE